MLIMMRSVPVGISLELLILMSVVLRSGMTMLPIQAVTTRRTMCAFSRFVNTVAVGIIGGLSFSLIWRGICTSVATRILVIVRNTHVLSSLGMNTIAIRSWSFCLCSAIISRKQCSFRRQAISRNTIFVCNQFSLKLVSLIAAIPIDF